jgi:hypothetical protein
MYTSPHAGHAGECGHRIAAEHHVAEAEPEIGQHLRVRGLAQRVGQRRAEFALEGTAGMAPVAEDEGQRGDLGRLVDLVHDAGGGEGDVDRAGIQQVEGLAFLAELGGGKDTGVDPAAGALAQLRREAVRGLVNDAADGVVMRHADDLRLRGDGRGAEGHQRAEGAAGPEASRGARPGVSSEHVVTPSVGAPRRL